MKVSLAWRNAVAFTSAPDYEYDRKEGFDKRLQLGLIARFQIDYRKEPLPYASKSSWEHSLRELATTNGRLLTAFSEHIADACKSGVLRYEIASGKKGDDFYSWLIDASDFAEWLATDGTPPSVHIQAWFDEAGVSLGKATEPEEKPLATRERNTLLTIIAVLCKEANLDPTKPAKTAGMILHTATGMGLQIGETTIETHLKRIPDALESRMK